MRPLVELTAQQAQQIEVLFTDIDGTLTDTAGRIPAAVFSSLETAQAAGMRCVPVTGRPAGWCDMIARTWPVDAVIGENGGLYFQRSEGPHGGEAMKRVYAQTEAVRATHRARLNALATQVLTTFPGTALASDQGYRAFDIAIDFCEDVPALPDSTIDAIVLFLQEAGCQVKVSNIHVNAWFGEFDKASMCRRFSSEVVGLDLRSTDAQRCVFFGDSPNDSPLFALFPLAVGVANVMDMADRIDPLPSFVTTARGGQGFVEGLEHILRLRY